MNHPYFEEVSKLCKIESIQITEVVELMFECVLKSSSIWLMGNGGSASTANHFETDLSFVRFGYELPKVKVFSLVSNSSLLSAIANDIGFENLFAHQLARKASPGDLCVLISASGNSPNLVAAVKLAKKVNVKTVALLGFDGGVLKTLVDYPILVESPMGLYGPVEDVHSALCHLISAQLLKKLVGRA